MNSRVDQSESIKARGLQRWSGLTWAVCLGMTLLAAAVPFLRSFYRVEVDYNEGWNIYNAATVAAHGWLYPAKYGWTSVNYPMLSFVIMAQLHRLTHEYLFTARSVSLLSLLTSAVLVGAIVRRMGRDGSRNEWAPAILATLFTVALFCANVDYYVGMDDPQMLAQVFFLAGLYVYMTGHRSLSRITLVATLFVVGGFIKHNPIDFPLAVLIDLLLVSRGRAAWFAAWGMILAVAGLALNTHFGGPHFLDQLLAPRSYSLGKAALLARNALGPILLPVCVAVYAAVRSHRDKERRIVAIFLATSLVLGTYFGGGSGVSVNSFFSAMFAIAILCGHLLSETWPRAMRGRDERGWWKGTSVSGQWSPLFLWLLIPLAISGNWRLPSVMRDTRVAQGQFNKQVAELRAASGPALCESLLRCYAADKPYVFDPFNATRLIQLGKLDQRGMVQSIEDGRYAAIQLDVALNDEAHIKAVDPAVRERFTPEMLEAIRRRYQLLSDDGTGAIYVPSRGASVETGFGPIAVTSPGAR